MDAKIKKNIEMNQFLTPQEFMRYDELVELDAQAAQLLQSSQGVENDDYEMIDALEGLDDEYDQFEIEKRNKETDKQKKLRLSYSIRINTMTEY